MLAQLESDGQQQGGISMTDVPVWQEVESEVHRPGPWLPCLVGVAFVLGAVGFLMAGVPNPLWLWRSFLGLFVMAGSAILIWAVRCVSSPVRVRHAAADVLPEVPCEPLVCEGVVAHGRLSHELRENASGWKLRPAENIRCNDRCFLFCFGIPFLIVFSALLAWSFQGELHGSKWPVAVLFAVLVTILCGGTVLLIIGLVMRANYRRLSRLTIPRHDGDVELETSETPDWSKTDVLAGLTWCFIGEKGPSALSRPQIRISSTGVDVEDVR